MKVLRNPFVWAFFLGAVFVTAIRPFLRFEPDPPPVTGHLPSFELVDRTGQPFGSRDLAGRVYVANFFFSRCQSICPTLMKSVARLQDRYDEAGVDGVRIVSITVDPSHDTPQQLREVANRYGVDSDRWTLLTGPRERIRELATEGFHVAVGERTETNGLMDIAHTGKLVLVDPEGGIRGYYSSDEEGIDEVFHRSQHVAGAFGG